LLYIRMGLFDFFKKKETAPEAQEALDKGLEKTKEGYHVKDYYMSGALQSEIFCTGITPKLQFDSELTLYYENGKPLQIGRFKDERPYGVHQFFYEDGTKKNL